MAEQERRYPRGTIPQRQLDKPQYRRPAQRQPQQQQKQPGPEPEKVLMTLSTSRLVYLKRYFTALIITVGSILISFFPSLTPLDIIEPYRLYFLVLLVLPLIIILMTELAHKRSSCVLTNKRIITRFGLFSRTETSLEYEMVSHYYLKQNTLERLFGLGSIEIQAVAGSSEPEVVMRKIPHAKKAKDIVEKYVTSTRGAYSRR